MKSRRKKVIVVSVAVFGVAVLVAAGFALKPAILEQWYIWNLESGDREEQWVAAARLASMGSKQAEQWYLRQLDSDSEEDRQTAAEILGEMRSAVAVPALMELFRQHNAKRLPNRSERYATAAIVVIGEPAIPALIQVFSDENPYVRSAALTAFEAIGPVAIPYLFDTLTDPDPLLRAGAGYALGKFDSLAREITPKLIQAYRDESPKVRSAVVCAIAAIGLNSDGGQKTLLQALHDPDKKVRLSAAFYLEGSKDPGAKAAVPVLISALSDKSSHVLERRTAARQLGKHKSEDAVPTLIGALDDNDVGLRRISCWALGEIGPDAKTAIQALMKLEGHSDGQLRKVAADALMKIQGASIDDRQR